MTDTVRDKILTLLGAQGALEAAKLTDDADLYDAGLTSFASVQLMLALEETFGVEFTESMLNRKTFASISNITSCVDELLKQKAA
jgi:acyl carrier protein